MSVFVQMENLAVGAATQVGVGLADDVPNIVLISGSGDFNPKPLKYVGMDEDSSNRAERPHSLHASEGKFIIVAGNVNPNKREYEEEGNVKIIALGENFYEKLCSLQLIEHISQDTGTGESIFLPNVDGETLEYVLEFLKGKGTNWEVPSVVGY